MSALPRVGVGLHLMHQNTSLQLQQQLHKIRAFNVAKKALDRAEKAYKKGVFPQCKMISDDYHSSLLIYRLRGLKKKLIPITIDSTTFTKNRQPLACLFIILDRPIHTLSSQVFATLFKVPHGFQNFSNYIYPRPPTHRTVIAPPLGNLKFRIQFPLF